MRLRFIVLAVIATLCFVAACGKQSPVSGPLATPSSPEASTPVSTLTATPYGTTTPTAVSSPKPSPTTTATGGRTLTESDAGTTVVLRVGESVEVSLGSEYHQPTASNDAITRTASSGGYPSGQAVNATFRAVKSGQADITSSTDYACLHSVPSCALPQRLWVVYVTVS